MSDEMKDCPACAEPIRAKAVRCRYCGHDIGQPIPASSMPPRLAGRNEPRFGLPLWAVLLGLVGLIGISAALQSRPASSSDVSIDLAQVAPADDAPPEEISKAHDRRQGFHCLSAWDGSNRDLVRQVKAGLRDPNSFEHADTTIGPVTDRGNHPVRMAYRARNGFGGMNAGEVWAAVDPADCHATIIDSEAKMDDLLGQGYEAEAGADPAAPST